MLAAFVAGKGLREPAIADRNRDDDCLGAVMTARHHAVVIVELRQLH
jgi:hypothetical protein